MSYEGNEYEKVELDESAGSSKWCGMPSRNKLLAGGAVAFTYVSSQLGSIFVAPLANKYVTNREPYNTSNFGCYNTTPNGADVDGAATAETVKCLYSGAIMAASALGGVAGLGTAAVVLGIAVGVAKIYNYAKNSECNKNSGYVQINSRNSMS